jgi:hypothetical protein
LNKEAVLSIAAAVLAGAATTLYFSNRIDPGYIAPVKETSRPPGGIDTKAVDRSTAGSEGIHPGPRASANAPPKSSEVVSLYPLSVRLYEAKQPGTYAKSVAIQQMCRLAMFAAKESDLRQGKGSVQGGKQLNSDQIVAQQRIVAACSDVSTRDQEVQPRSDDKFGSALGDKWGKLITKEPGAVKDMLAEAAAQNVLWFAGEAIRSTADGGPYFEGKRNGGLQEYGLYSMAVISAIDNVKLSDPDLRPIFEAQLCVETGSCGAIDVSRPPLVEQVPPKQRDDFVKLVREIEEALKKNNYSKFQSGK